MLVVVFVVVFAVVKKPRQQYVNIIRTLCRNRCGDAARIKSHGTQLPNDVRGGIAATATATATAAATTTATTATTAATAATAIASTISSATSTTVAGSAAISVRRPAAVCVLGSAGWVKCRVAERLLSRWQVGRGPRFGLRRRPGGSCRRLRR